MGGTVARLAWVRPPGPNHYATEPLMRYTKRCGRRGGLHGGTGQGDRSSPALIVFLGGEMGKHDDSDRRGNDRDDDRGKDDGKDTSKHSVEDDKKTATTPNPDDYK